MTPHDDGFLGTIGGPEENIAHIHFSALSDIIDDGKDHGTVPYAFFVENADFRLVEIQMP